MMMDVLWTTFDRQAICMTQSRSSTLLWIMVDSTLCRSELMIQPEAAFAGALVGVYLIA